MRYRRYMNLYVLFTHLLFNQTTQPNSARSSLVQRVLAKVTDIAGKKMARSAQYVTWIVGIIVG